MKSFELENYSSFINKKSQFYEDSGFKPIFMPDYLFDYQKLLTDWDVRKGRALLATDCGTGKSLLELVWAQNIVMKTNKNVLLLTPLAVSHQTLAEAEKFGIEASRSNDGSVAGKITITNYEKLHKFNKNDYIAAVLDESSILKNFDGHRKKEITEFIKKMPYRLLATATAAPNDFIELGTSSEALGYLGFIDMLNRYFKNERNNSALRRMFGVAPKFIFKGKAEIPFWRWVTSWARAMRKPSDYGFDDGELVLPKLIEKKHIIKDIIPPDGMLFNLPARKLDEQRSEIKRTINQRCEYVASLVNNTGKPAFIGCHLNDEGTLLNKLIPDAIEIHGREKNDEIREQKFIDFVNGNIRVLVTKPKIGAWGLNFQHCNHIVYFPDHSYEKKYQFIRRCYRFFQKRNVFVDYVLTPGELRILENLDRKSKQADIMFNNLIAEMQHSMNIKPVIDHTKIMEIPQWI